MVTADGRVLSVSADENVEPFWCIKGGNFGALTQCEIPRTGQVELTVVTYGRENIK